MCNILEYLLLFVNKKLAKDLLLNCQIKQLSSWGEFSSLTSPTLNRVGFDNEQLIDDQCGDLLVMPANPRTDFLVLVIEDDSEATMLPMMNTDARCVGFGRKHTDISVRHFIERHSLVVHGFPRFIQSTNK